MPKGAHSPFPRRRHSHAAQPRRLLVYAHHNQWGNLADYVPYLIRQVRRLYERIVFISTSLLTPESCALLDDICNAVLQRQDISSIFPAWKEALSHEGSNHLSEYDSVTLMNSSCIGPLHPLAGTYRRMESQSIDFWGMTYSPAPPSHMKQACADNICVPALQSFFLCFHKNAVVSSAFHDFWELIREGKPTDKSKLEYEALLCDMMSSAGLKSGVVYETANRPHDSPPKVPTSPEEILEQGVPFLKIEAFFSGLPPENAFLLSWIKRHTRYPWKILDQYLRTHFSPETSLQVIDHTLNVGERCQKKADEQRIGIHIHAFYPDILPQILGKLRHREQLQPDIFLTTDSTSKVTEIRQILQKNFPHLPICEIFVFENRGRDIYPWLKIAPMLEHYDFVGHFHTKKRGGIAGRIRLEEVLDCLLGRPGQIKRVFANKPQLGIVIPDIPSLYKYVSKRPQFFSDLNLKEQLTRIWERLGCKRKLDFFVMKTLVFPYGNMFWYRPLALKKMWHHHWDLTDIPAEPIPNHGTLLHTLERLPVYVAWDQGYDFTIAPPTTCKAMGFQVDLALCDYKSEDRKTSIIQHMRMKMRESMAKNKI